MLTMCQTDILGGLSQLNLTRVQRAGLRFYLHFVVKGIFKALHYFPLPKQNYDLTHTPLLLTWNNINYIIY